LYEEIEEDQKKLSNFLKVLSKRNMGELHWSVLSSTIFSWVGILERRILFKGFHNS
jgi:hypothetical protein